MALAGRGLFQDVLFAYRDKAIIPLTFSLSSLACSLYLFPGINTIFRHHCGARALSAREISRTKLVWLFWIKLVTALFDAMRPLPSLLLLCGSYGGTAIEYGSSTGQHGLDYCIAEADTTRQRRPPWQLQHVRCHGQILHPMPVTTYVPGMSMCEHNPTRAERSEQCVQSASSSTFEPAVHVDNPILNWATKFSCSGGMFFFYGCLFQWFSKMQRSRQPWRYLRRTPPRRRDARRPAHEGCLAGHLHWPGDSKRSSRTNGVSPSLLELWWMAPTIPDTQRVTLTAHNTL